MGVCFRAASTTPMKPLALAIENDAGTRKLLDVLLTRSGVDVDLVPTGSDALILLAAVPYDLLLIDLLLPGTSGMQILEWIASERPAMLARSIVLSSAPEWQLQRVHDQWPQVRVIRKPFELGDVVEAAQAISASREDRIPSFAETFCRHSVCAGARAGLIVAENNARVDALHAFGFAPGEVESYFPLPLESPIPLCAAIRNAAPVWLASVTLTGTDYPLLRPAAGRNENRALAAVPLLRNGRAVGAVGWSFREPRLFTDRDQQTFLTMAAAFTESLPDRNGPPATAAGA